MRFNSREHLDPWRANGAFPAIHNDIFALIIDNLDEDARAVDLCCSLGLLGTRVMMAFPRVEVVGIDVDDRARRFAEQHGVPVLIARMHLKPPWTELETFLREGRTTAVFARRCLPELLGDLDAEERPLFGQALARAGVRQLFIEGRVDTRRASNALRNVDREIEVLEPTFQLRKRFRECAYLEVASGTV